MTGIVKDCSVCHGKTVVRARVVSEQGRNGKVRVICCPQCNGVGSWLALPYRHDRNADWQMWLALQQDAEALTAKGDYRTVSYER